MYQCAWLVGSDRYASRAKAAVKGAVGVAKPRIELATESVIEAALEENRAALTSDLDALSMTVEGTIRKQLEAFVARADKLVAATNATMAAELKHVQEDANASLAVKQGMVENLSKQVAMYVRCCSGSPAAVVCWLAGWGSKSNG